MTVEEEPGRRGSKAGRNEARKLTANALNNAGVAFGLAALLQPALAFLQQDRWPTLAVIVGSSMFVLTSFALLRGAQIVVRRLED